MTMGDLEAYRIKRGDLDRHTAVGGHATEWTRGVGREHDHAVAIPRAAVPDGRIGYGLRRRAEEIDLLQLTVREEPDEATVRRPEREPAAGCHVGPLAARDRLSRHMLERPEPKRSPFVRPRSGDQPGAIRRQCEM